MTADAAIAARTWAREAGIWLPAPPTDASREVSFSVGLEWAAPYLAAHQDLPTFGTPAWRDETEQRRKTAAAVVAALDWAMRIEARTTARIAASHSVSEAANWPAIGRIPSHEVRCTMPDYIPRRAA
ncbi:DUF2742 domain-containing protein [Tsukamurella spumae]|uniref:DUF2742 domain-containing protein n=1 Tax=Tsukamurella spumae TaxID=44753 RepID=A0A846X1I1_9ACTN|nr:DUF2742 domain-containing protein [Tsukamurella spumae]NKY17800.1 DUF2742 domain-containing protein [Tsukamurella spumae]